MWIRMASYVPTGSGCWVNVRRSRRPLRRRLEMRRKRPSDETLVLLRRKLEELPPRSEERRHLIVDCADLHGVSDDTIYRAPRAIQAAFVPEFAVHRHTTGIDATFQRVGLVAKVYVS